MQRISAYVPGGMARASPCPPTLVPPSPQLCNLPPFSRTCRYPCSGPRSACSARSPVEQATSGRAVSVVAAASKPAGSKGATGGKGFGASNAPSVSKSGVSQTCACGSKLVYRECCEPYHLGTVMPPDVNAALRARFCGFVKGRVPYLVSTFHPSYHSFKYEGSAPGDSTPQLRRDVEAATKRFMYSNLKVLEMAPGSNPNEAFITFRYNSVNKLNPERNFDGSIKISTTVERSRFVRDQPDSGTGSSTSGSTSGSRPTWLFADYELIDYPTWMEDAKQSELRARGGQSQAAA